MRTTWTRFSLGAGVLVALALGGCGGSSTGEGTGGAGGGAGATGVVVYEKSVDLASPPRIFAIAPDGTGDHALTPGGTDFPTDANSEPVLSPDGATVLFASGRDFSGGAGGGVQNPTLRLLYTMAPDGSGAARVTQNDPAYCSEHAPRYSHDGAWIVFSMSCDDDPVTPYMTKLYRIRTDGSGQERLASQDVVSTGDSNVVEPVWSPDDAVVYASVLGGGTSADLYAIDVAAGTSTRVTDHAAASRYVSGAAMPLAGGDLLFMTLGDFSLPAPAPRIERVHGDGSGQSVVFPIEVLSAPPSLAGVARDRDFALAPDEQSFVFVTYADPTASPPTQVLARESLAGDARATIGSAAAHVASPYWR